MAWSGVAFLVMMGSGFVMTGLLPPFAPIKSADQVTQFWPTNTGLAYFNFWAAFLYVAAGLVVLFKTGPFAWNGLIAFRVVASVFGGWLIILTGQLLATIESSTVVASDQQPRFVDAAATE